MGAGAAKLYEPQMIDFKDILFGPSSMKLLSFDGLTVLFVEDVHEPPKEKICGNYSDKTKWIDSVLDQLFTKVNFPINFFLETTEFYKSYLQKFKQEDLFKDDRGITKSVYLFHNCVNITEKECGYLDTHVFFNNMEIRRFEASKKYSFNTGKLSFLKLAFSGERDTLFDLPELYLNKVIRDILVKTRYYNVIVEVPDIKRKIEKTTRRFNEDLKYRNPDHDLELDVILDVFEKHDSTFEYTKTDDKAKNHLEKILEMLNLLNDPDKLKSLFSNLLYSQKLDDNFDIFKSMFSMFNETREIFGDEKNPHFKFSKQLKTGIYDENIKKQILEYIDELCNKQEFKKEITDAIKICERLITIIFEKTNNFQKLRDINNLMTGIRNIFFDIHKLTFDMYNIARFMRMYPFDESEFEFAIVYAGRDHTTNMIGFLTKYYKGKIIASINTNSDEDACIKFDTKQKFVKTLDEILLKLQSKDIITNNFFLEKIPRREDINLENVKKEIKILKKSKDSKSKESLKEIIKLHKYLLYDDRMKKRLEKYSGKQIVAKPLLTTQIRSLPQPSLITERPPPPKSTSLQPSPDPSPQPSPDPSPQPSLITERPPPSKSTSLQPSKRTLLHPSLSTERPLPPKRTSLQPSPDPSPQALSENENKPGDLPGAVPNSDGGYKYNSSLYFNHCF
jgi:hypothetical protein